MTEEGFGPSGFHAWPNTLRIDGYSGDYGSGFFGHAVNVATYVTRDSTFGWLAFGGNWRVARDTVVVTPLDAARSRLFIGPLGLWITLDAGTIEKATIVGRTIRLTLSPADRFTPVARVRIEGDAMPVGEYQAERGAWVVPLGDGQTSIDVIARR